MAIRMAVVTDIHHGPASHTKAADWQALPALERFIDHAIANGADMVLDLGDHISDTTEENDRRYASEVAEIFQRFPGPVHHIIGNHDIVNLSVADNEAIFGQSLGSKIIDLGTVRLIVWQPGVAFSETDGFLPTGRKIDWLATALAESDKPAIIASHVPVAAQSQIGNHYFERRPHLATYPDHEAIRAALEASGRAALWLSGHVHRNTAVGIRGIQHVTIQSLSERSTTMPDTAGAYADIIITDETVTVDIHGKDPFYVRLPFQPSGRKTWLPVMTG